MLFKEVPFRVTASGVLADLSKIYRCSVSNFSFLYCFNVRFSVHQNLNSTSLNVGWLMNCAHTRNSLPDGTVCDLFIHYSWIIRELFVTCSWTVLVGNNSSPNGTNACVSGGSNTTPVQLDDVRHLYVTWKGVGTGVITCLEDHLL